MRTDDPRACRYCGDPLPERTPGQRGRPRVVHDGACKRLYRNRQKLDARMELFRAAHRPDRSDERPVFGYGLDPDDLDEGFEVELGGWDGRPVPPPVLEAWEAAQRRRKLIRKHEQREHDAEAARAIAALDEMSVEECTAYLAELCDRRRARADFRTQLLR